MHPEACTRYIDPLRSRGILRARLCRRAAHDLHKACQAAAGSYVLSVQRGEPVAVSHVNTGTCGSRCDSPISLAEALRGARAPARRIGSAADDLRSAARRVSFGRRRFECGRRDHGAASRPSPSTPARSLSTTRPSTNRAMRSRSRIGITRGISSSTLKATTSTSSTSSPRLYDEPYADSSAIPTYRVCQLARKHVTVALSGDGGDESFGGYRRYRLHLMEERLRRPPAARRAPAVVRRCWVASIRRPTGRRACFARRPRSKSLARNSVEAYLHSVSILREPMRRDLFSRTCVRASSVATASPMSSSGMRSAPDTDDPLALIQYLDLKTYLVGDINTKVDRASMAHSLEVREPLMDHPLVEWLRESPSSLKMHGDGGEVPAEEGDGADLSHEILYRPKMGFAVPLARWFRGPLRQRVRDDVLNGALVETGYFEQSALRRMVEDHQSGRRDYSGPLWSALMFEAFLRNVNGLSRPVIEAARRCA